MTSRRIVAAVQLPPPINGLTLISGAMLEKLRQAFGEDVRLVKLAPAAVVVQATFARRLTRLFSMLAPWFKATAHFLESILLRRRLILYITISGGIGQLLEWPVILLYRLTATKIVVHHHSFAYCNSSSALSRITMRLLGFRAIHICLGASMAARLRELYGVADARVMSNAAFQIQSAGESTEHSALTLGFLGNLEISKGILQFVDLLKQLKAAGVEFRAIVAGPFLRESDQWQILGNLENLSGAEYRGPVYGERKEAFFREIDVLIFPSRYKNEAEPLTIIESIARAVPVIAIARGCIGDILDGDLAPCLISESQFPEKALPLLSDMSTSIELRRSMKAAAQKRFGALKHEAAIVLEELLEELKL